MTVTTGTSLNNVTSIHFNKRYNVGFLYCERFLPSPAYDVWTINVVSNVSEFISRLYIDAMIWKHSRCRHICEVSCCVRILSMDDVATHLTRTPLPGRPVFFARGWPRITRSSIEIVLVTDFSRLMLNLEYNEHVVSFLVEVHIKISWIRTFCQRYF